MKREYTGILLICFLAGGILSHLQAVSIVHEIGHAIGYLISGADVRLTWTVTYASSPSALGSYAGPWFELFFWWFLGVGLIARGKPYYYASAVIAGILVDAWWINVFSDDFVALEVMFRHDGAALAWGLVAGVMIAFLLAGHSTRLYYKHRAGLLQALPSR